MTALHLDEANKLVQELNDRKKELKAAMFSNKLASFIEFPSIGEASLLGELAFTHIQLPFKKLGIDNTALQPLDTRVDHDFVLLLEHGQRFVTFNWFDCSTHMSSYDLLGRLLGSDSLDFYVSPENAAQCGPNHFAVCYDFETPIEYKLSVYNSSLHRVRSVDCKEFSQICCNSKFVFGLFNPKNPYNYDSDDSDEQEKKCSAQRIQVHHVDTLSKAFCLGVPAKYTIERIMADEHRVVAMSRQKRSESPASQWFMSALDLPTAQGDKTACKCFLEESYVRLAVESVCLPNSVFLFDGWLVFPRENENELIWFDKNGTRSETSTEWDSKNLRDIYSSGSSLLFSQPDGKLLLKR